MRIENDVHRARPWRVHELARDFDLLDVWRFDIAGRSDELSRFLALHEARLEDDQIVDSAAARFLFRLRWWLGEVFGLDGAQELPIPGTAERSVRERLEAAPEDDGVDAGPFRRVYAGTEEALYEISNRTVHALLHLGWVETEGHYAPEMAVYVKPRGLSGRLYMRLIDPFRHLVVYPALMRDVRRAWG